MINVTNSYLPPLEEYTSYLKELWESRWLTNRGKLVNKLEQEIDTYLDIKNTLYVGNGTIAIQIALKALEISGEIITTPFSYVATTTSILWENSTPVFADIEPRSFCIDPVSVRKCITPNTKAILATHVYGYPCDVTELEKIANEFNLKVIYDAAHAFGVKYQGQSIMNYGHLSTCSFHATKLFHTVEGGAIFTANKELRDKCFLLHTFGHLGDDYFIAGINGKNSEFHAAMGLCNLPKVNELIEARKKVCDRYTQNLLGTQTSRPQAREGTEYNYAYYPILFKNEETLLKVKAELAKNQINVRRYFYPSLNVLPYIGQANRCPVSEDVALRVVSLPLYHDLSLENVDRISDIIKQNL